MGLVVDSLRGWGLCSRVERELGDEDEIDEVEVDGQVALEGELVGEQTADQIRHIAREPVEQEGQREAGDRFVLVVRPDLRQLGEEPAQLGQVAQEIRDQHSGRGCVLLGCSRGSNCANVEVRSLCPCAHSTRAGLH